MLGKMHNVSGKRKHKPFGFQTAPTVSMQFLSSYVFSFVPVMVVGTSDFTY